MKLEGWLKVFFPLILGLGVFILIFLINIRGPCATGGFEFWPTPRPPLPDYCKFINPLLSLGGIYFFSLLLMGVVTTLWEVLAKVFRFKPASSVKLRWYFISAPIMLVILYVLLYIGEVLNID